MKMFVFDFLKNGVWKPWFVDLMDFRTALQKMNSGKDFYKYRARRVKTREEFEKYLIMESVTVTKHAKNTDLWKVEWV
jgi:hypothetical protein